MSEERFESITAGETRDERKRACTETVDRRRLLGMVATTGAIGLAGCTVDEDGIEVSFSGSSDDAGVEDDVGPVEEATDDQSGDEETGESAEEGTDEDEQVAKTHRVHEFHLTSESDMNVFGRIAARGIFDEDEYLTPEGRRDWEIWHREDDEYISLERDTPTEVNANAIIEFPEEAVEDIDRSEPFIIVRGDFVRVREQPPNEFLGWESTRTFLEMSTDVEYGEQELSFTETDADLRLTYSITPL